MDPNYETACHLARIHTFSGVSLSDWANQINSSMCPNFFVGWTQTGWCVPVPCVFLPHAHTPPTHTMKWKTSQKSVIMHHSPDSLLIAWPWTQPLRLWPRRLISTQYNSGSSSAVLFWTKQPSLSWYSYRSVFLTSRLKSFDSFRLRYQLPFNFPDFIPWSHFCQKLHGY